MEAILGAIFVIKLVAKGQRLQGCISAFTGESENEGIEDVDASFSGYL